MESKQSSWLLHLLLDFPLFGSLFPFPFQVVRINGEPRTSESAGFKLRDHLEIGDPCWAIGKNGEPFWRTRISGEMIQFEEHNFQLGWNHHINESEVV